MSAAIAQLGTVRILYDPERLSMTGAPFEPQADLLRPAYWQARGAIRACFNGRGTAWAVDTPAGAAVLRRFRRGGMAARVNRHHYLFTGWARSRAFREWHLLAELAELGLPVPRPLAASCERRGPFYRAGLLTERISGARTLVERMQAGPLSPAVWQEIGAVLRAFHDHGVAHPDLNARNLLLDDSDRPWLIDFDRGRRIDPAVVWRQRTLARLRRSLDKTTELQNEDWSRLLAGYFDAPAAPG